MFDGHPETWQQYGDLATHARNSWLALIAGRDLAMRESIERTALAKKDELAGLSATPLEKLLADRVGACWLQVNFADAAIAQAGSVSESRPASACPRVVGSDERGPVAGRPQPAPGSCEAAGAPVWAVLRSS